MDEKKQLYEKKFQELQNYIGREVACIYWEFGKMEGYRGILKNVLPFDYVNIGNEMITFVGQRSAIEYILLLENEKVKPIYSSHEVKYYHGSITDLMSVINYQKQILGHSILEEELKNPHAKLGR